MIDCFRAYDSAYTMEVDDDIVEFTDTIHFRQTPDGEYIGEGQPDAAGDTMVLRLREIGSKVLAGTWQEEQRATGNIIGSGVVSFGPETDGIDGMIGQWDTNGGSWSLIRQTEAPVRV